VNTFGVKSLSLHVHKSRAEPTRSKTIRLARWTTLLVIALSCLPAAPRNTDLDWTSPPLDTVPIFWNRQMTPAWGRMLGLWIDLPQAEARKHTLDAFPTTSNFDWQWAQIINKIRAVNLDHLPENLEPTVWAIDDWNRNYKLGVIFECMVGDGRLLVSAFGVTNPVDSNPVARQLRSSLVNYMRTDCFQPSISVSREQMRSLFFDTLIMKKLGATAKVEGVTANTAIDGDPNTFVLVGDQHGPVREQVDLAISFPKPVAMSGLVLKPRQNHREHEGDIREYMIQRSDDGILVARCPTGRAAFQFRASTNSICQDDHHQILEAGLAHRLWSRQDNIAVRIGDHLCRTKT
jgi:beta-galactosidase